MTCETPEGRVSEGATGPAAAVASGSSGPVDVVGRDGGHEARVAVAVEAAAQVAVWQARLVEAVAALVAADEIADPWRPYLAHRLGLTPSEAGQVLELADRLGELPVVAGLLARGERSMGAVLALARRATPETEGVLVGSAESLTGGQLLRLLADYDRVAAPSERVEGDEGRPEDPAEQPSTARTRRRGGRRQVVLDLDDADAAEWDRAIDAERRRLDATDDGVDSAAAGPFERSYGAAAMALVRRAVGARLAGRGEPRLAPATVQTTLVLHVTETDAGLRLHRAVYGGSVVPDWVVAMLVERGELTAVVALNGEPLFASSPTRLATAEQRRALLVRDGHCQYPGCATDTGRIAHHIHYHDHGGPTRLDNLLLVCRRHHRVVHRYALRIHRAPGERAGPGRWRFTTATGRPLDPTRPHLPTEARRARAGPRHTGTNEPLTWFARDVLLHHWLTTTPTTTAA